MDQEKKKRPKKPAASSKKKLGAAGGFNVPEYGAYESRTVEANDK